MICRDIRARSRKSVRYVGKLSYPLEIMSANLQENLRG